MITAAVIAFSFCAWRIGRRTRFFLHIIQLEGYNTRLFWRWLKEHSNDAVFRMSHILGALWLIVLLMAGAALPGIVLTLVVLLWAVTFASSRRYRRDKPKKPLVFTHRLRRLMGITTVLLLTPVILGTSLSYPLTAWESVFLFLSGLYVADLGAPYAVLLAALLARPIERVIQRGFKAKARRRLSERTELQVIAITGSYGKTSVKNIVDEVLSHRYPVLATPASYNTPMGVCKVVNNDLTDSHRLLVLEMGIRHPGDIDELCRIASPDVALITSVGVSHLESMGTLEAIAHEKSSLLSFLKPGGDAVLNFDDERVRDMADGIDEKVWFVSTDESSGADITAFDITYGPEGSTFTVSDETGARCGFSTSLVGLHNVTNILMAIAVGRINGLRLRQLRQAISRLKPIPHRLEVKKSRAITIIDDAFNSNPVGAKNAIEILGQFDAGRKIIVTPGMIELGDRQHDENWRMGTLIAESADLAILVGEHQTKSILEGLRSTGYPEFQIRVVQSLSEAQKYLETFLQDGDVILYENDLPDQFNEA